jgi:tRNA pseudouridine32 synthase/23S rRNA pseudouridine746 synthase
MLVGLEVESNPLKEIAPPEPKIVWEDGDIVVIDKPSGMLSVRGKSGVRSAEEWATERYPEAMIVHRLDQSTSGILVIAKHKVAHEALLKIDKANLEYQLRIAELCYLLRCRLEALGTRTLWYEDFDIKVAASNLVNELL